MLESFTIRKNGRVLIVNIPRRESVLIDLKTMKPIPSPEFWTIHTIDRANKWLSYTAESSYIFMK
jgi:hypothetical protein